MIKVISIFSMRLTAYKHIIVARRNHVWLKVAITFSSRVLATVANQENSANLETCYARFDSKTSTIAIVSSCPYSPCRVLLYLGMASNESGEGTYIHATHALLYN